MGLMPVLPDVEFDDPPPRSKTWIPVLVMPEALDDLSDAIREALVYVQGGDRRFALWDALQRVDKLRGDEILRAARNLEPPVG